MLINQLEKLNDQIDRIALEKRLSIEAEHLKRIKCTRTLRIYVVPSENDIRIFTRVLSENTDEEPTDLWDLVKRIVVSFNSNIPGADNKNNANTVREDENNDSSQTREPPSEEAKSFSFASVDLIHEWTRSSGAYAFAVQKPKTFKNVQVLIKLTNKRQMFKLNDDLRVLFDKHADTKPNIIKDFYRYVNALRLNDYTTSEVKCDEKLEKILKMKSFNFNDIGEMVDMLVEPIGYCTIDIDAEKPQIWDISMECDDLSQRPHLYPKNVLEIEKKIESTRECAKKIEKKIGELEEFIQDPIYFINRKIAVESDGIGVQTKFYDNLDVQTAVYELLRKSYK